MRKRKCYIYTRVSTAAQTEGYSLEAQVERLREYAEYRDLQIVGEYCDAGKSGKSIKGRPAFQEMMDDIVNGKDDVSYVLVFKLSRFGRNAADVLKSMQLLNDYDVDLVCVDDAIDSSTQGGRLTLAILSAVAEIERENITVQFNAGRMQKVLEGGWPGGPVPYGYRNIKKQMQIEPAEAELVKKMFEAFLMDGMTTTSVAAYMNEHGYRRMIKGEERPFTYDFVANALDNPFYCGKILYGKRSKKKEVMTIQGVHEPIIEESLWEQVQEKRKTLSVKWQKLDDPERISILSGLVKCPLCGKGLIASKSKHVNKNRGGHYKTIHYYSCRNHRKASGRECSFKRILNQSKIDSSVFEIFSGITALPEYHEMIANVLGNQPSVELLEKEMKALRKQLRSYETQKRKLGEELDGLDILDDDYDKNYDRIQAEIDEIYDRMDDAESSISKKKKKLSAVKNGIRSIEKVKELVEHMQLLFPKMTCDEQREMYRLFIERIDVFPEEQDSGKMIKSITFKFPIYYENYETVPTRCPDDQIGFVLDCSTLGLTVAEAKATYVEIKAYIKEKFGVKISSLYIAQIKRKYGLDLGKNYNLSKKENARVPTCPKEKEAYIMDALKHFRMLDVSVEMEA